jgi:predicted adenine nucleotide alpha hydrolase (AANH) superfamily ATPase
MMLVHVCCADCTLKLVDSIKKDPEVSGEEIHLYYYNPNIHPQSEFTARQIAVQKISIENNLKLIIANWIPGEYFQTQSKLSTEQKFDKSYRCPNCWLLRLGKTFMYAKENYYQSVTSTLVTSKYMHQAEILKIAGELSKKYCVKFYIPKQINCDLHTVGFYKQNYCGCVYSLLERMNEKYAISVK